MTRKAPKFGSVPPQRGNPMPAVPAAAQEPEPKPASVRRAGRRSDDPVSLGLRKLWEHVEKEPVPDAMLALLDAIDAARNPDSATAENIETPPRQSGDGA